MSVPNPFGRDLVVTVWWRRVEEGLHQYARPGAERCSVCMHVLRTGEGDFEQRHGQRGMEVLRCKRCSRLHKQEVRGTA